MKKNIKTYGPLVTRPGGKGRILSRLCILIIVFCSLSGTSYAVNSLTQFGITWTFNDDIATDTSEYYQYGTFANGDYWIIEHAGGGSVLINTFDPASTTGERIKNGSMVNIDPTVYKFGWDNTVLYITACYDSAYNVALDVDAGSPLTVAANSSLVSSISVEAAGQQPQIQTVAVLTVLASAPAANSFRPPYCGSDKTINFNKSDLDYEVLADLTAVDDTPVMATVAAYFAKPWLDHWAGCYGRQIHPADSMPDYGTAIAMYTGIGALMLNLDYTDGEKEALLVGYVQLGIDLYGIVENGGRIHWQNDGGHGAGRKMPILLAGIVLNDTDMKAIGDKSGDYLYDGEYEAGSEPPTYIHFQEDDQTFYVKDADSYTPPYDINGYSTGLYTTGTVKVTGGSKIVEGVGTAWLANTAEGRSFGLEEDTEAYSPTGRTHTIDSVDSDTQITLTVAYRGNTDLTGDATYVIKSNGYYGHGYSSEANDWIEFTEADHGVPSWGLLHSTTPSRDGNQWTMAYQVANAQVWGGFLAALIVTDMKTLWNHDALFHYMDRHMAYYEQGTSQRQTNDFLENMWNTYRADYGDVWTLDSDPDNIAPVLAAIGDKSVDENSELSFAISATDADEDDTITYSATNLPSGAALNSSSGAFSWTPGYTQAGSHSVTFIARDNHYASSSEIITITVNNVNRPPVFYDTEIEPGNEGDLLDDTISATDPDGDTITYSANLPSGAALGSSSGEFTWTPDYTQAGNYDVTFTASDGTEQDSEPVTITVNNTNRAPVIDPTIGDKALYPNNLLSFTISATDPDGESVTYSATNLPSGASLNSSSGAFSWTPDSSQSGDHVVTFAAGDGQLEDTEEITITVYDADVVAPQVTDPSPEDDDIQVSLNNLVILHVTDAGEGVEASTVSIEIDGNTIYTGDTADHSSTYGHCRRVGTAADYTYIYQGDETFTFDQTVTVTVNATDQAGNAMSEHSYSFDTEMRSFGENKLISSTTEDDDNAVTVCDSGGDIWTAWHTGTAGSRDIYIGKLTAGADSFAASLQLTTNSNDQLNPSLAIDGDDKLYIAWQDNRNGEWDVYVSTSTDGVTWSTERKVTDPNSNQINPVIALDNSSPAASYLAWEDNRNTHKDIYIASSTNSFLTKTTSRVTSNASNQTNPAIAIDSSNTVYLLWTDQRNGSEDIYGADSDNGPWTNVAVATGSGGQSDAVIAAEDSGQVLHFAWARDLNGDSDIYYASSTGMPSSALTGSNVVNDTSGANQTMPTILAKASTGNNLKVFICWKDQRDSDTDLYFVEAAGTETNIFVGDDVTNSNQSGPAVGIGSSGYPYIVWTDDRNADTDIYYAASTFVNSAALASVDVTAAPGATVGTDPASITGTDDASVVIPASACLCDAAITISRVENPQKFSLTRFSFPYEFGPTGMEFSSPVTITIPYDVSDTTDSISAYWYNPLTGSLSQQGITDVEIIEVSPTIHALQFKTTHFTQFFVGSVVSGIGGGGGGGGGGCSLASGHETNMVEFLIPYAVILIVFAILKRRDAQKRRQQKFTGTD